jgi:PAS domain S-box-containing protein
LAHATPTFDAAGHLTGAVNVLIDVSERKRTENRLHKTEKELADFFDDAAIGLHWIGADGIIKRANAADLAMLGYAGHEFVGHPIAGFHEDKAASEDILRQLRSGEELHNFETRLRCKDGGIKDVLITTDTFRESGELIHTRCFTRDISQQKRAYRRLATKDAVTRALAESATLRDAAPAILRAICEHLHWQAGGLWQVGPTTRVLLCSSVWHLPAIEITEFEANCRQRTFAPGIGLPGRVWASRQPVWIPDIDHDTNFPRAQSAIKAGLHGAFGFPIVLNGDVLGIMEFFSHEVRQPDDELLHMMTIIGSQIGQFIERKRAEEAAQQSARRLRFLADASAALAELTDTKRTLERVAALATPQFADWCAVDILIEDGRMRRLAVARLGPDNVELAPELCQDYLPDLLDEHGVSKVLQTGRPDWAGEISEEALAAFASDAKHLQIFHELGLTSYICVPLRSHAKTLGVLWFVIAGSGRVYSADDVRSAEDLAARAAIAIENANLLAEMKEADRRKSEFLAMLAHELRNPLAPLRNGLHIMRLAGEDSQAAAQVRGMMERQLGQMVRLIDDLLDLSRITHGKIELHREQIDLATVIQDAIDTSRPLITAARHELIVNLPPAPVIVYADRNRLAQVFANLLNNSAKFTEKSGRIWLSAERHGSDVLVKVKDTGIGIPAEMLPKIFEMFTQADRSLERSRSGLGIGLSLVQRLVEMHGGRVEAHSEGPGTGSEFIVRLSVVLEPGRGAPWAGAGDMHRAPHCRILIVDDNKDSALSLAMLLRMLGHETRTAHDGLEGVEAAKDFRPNVVLLDIGLPKLSGYDVCRSIRAQPWSDGMVIIALSGWGQEEDKRRAREAGFHFHLTKPVNPADLQNLLAGLVLTPA